jgi:hypothetical protein
MTNLCVSVYPSVSIRYSCSEVLLILPSQSKIISKYGTGFLEANAVFQLVAPVLLRIPFILHRRVTLPRADIRGLATDYRHFPNGMLPSKYFKSSSRQRMPPPNVKAVWLSTLSTPLRRKIVGVVGFSVRKMYSP